MRIHNVAIAAIFNEMADILEIKGENPFRIRAYRTAARIVYGLSQDVSELLSNGDDLSKLPGIGKDLALKIEEIASSGHLEALEKVKKSMPSGLINLLRVSGLGGKRVAILNSRLGIKTVDELKHAALDHKIQTLPGFGEKIEKNILDGIRQTEESGTRLKLFDAEEIVNRIVRHMQNARAIKKMVVAGSFRRRKETVRDIDILITGENGGEITGKFLGFPEISRVISHGESRVTVFLVSGVQVDLRIVPVQSYGAALHYFTGSKAHNIEVRKRGIKAGLKINEYGVFRNDIRLSGESEEDVYRAIGLPYIEPELREDTGEFEAAASGSLPELIELTQIRGDLHAHTNRTDGHASLRQMVDAAQLKGYEYLAITDHSQKLAMTRGLTEKDLAEQIDLINKLNHSLQNFTVLKGIEVDILEDGSLDLKDSILRELDLTVCSIHSKFNLSRGAQTERIVRAMDNPYFTILAHPTGRLINKRMPYDIDMSRILEKAKDRGCFVEVNSYPDRLDLNDIHCRLAKEIGVKVAISTDAHSVNDLGFMRFGISQARRGWLEKVDVINSREIKELRKLFIT